MKFGQGSFGTNSNAFQKTTTDAKKSWQTVRSREIFSYFKNEKKLKMQKKNQRKIYHERTIVHLVHFFIIIYRFLEHT